MDGMPAAPVEEPEAPRGASPAAADEANEATQAPAVVFSVYNYGFRFLREELDALEEIFARNRGATPAHTHLQCIAASMSAAPVRLAEPPHPVREKQIKTWFENRRQKLRRQQDRAASRIASRSKRSRSEEEERLDQDDGVKDASVMAAATALLEASVAVPTPQAKGHQQQLTPVRGVPLLACCPAESGAELTPIVASPLAAPAEAACSTDSGLSAVLNAVREEVARSTLSAHTKELVLLHLLHSWSVLRTVSEADTTPSQ